MKNERLYLVHIAEALQSIIEYTAEGEAFFQGDPKTQDAVLRKFEIIGEATKRLSPRLREQAPEIPWGRMARFRDLLIHAYDRVDLTVVWQTIEIRVPELLQQVQAFMRRLEIQ